MLFNFSFSVRQATKVANAVRRHTCVAPGGNPWPALLSISSPPHSGREIKTVTFRWEGGDVVAVSLRDTSEGPADIGRADEEWVVTGVVVRRYPFDGEWGAPSGAPTGKIEKELSFAELEAIKMGEFGWGSPHLNYYPSLEEDDAA